MIVKSWRVDLQELFTIMLYAVAGNVTRIRSRRGSRRRFLGVMSGTAIGWENSPPSVVAAPSVDGVDVTFIKTDQLRYGISINRSKGTTVPRQVQALDAYLPHDLAQFLIEEQFGIRLGVYGQLAAGAVSAAAAGPRDRSGRQLRAARRLAEMGRADVQRSERLVALCRSLWEARAGRVPSSPAVIDMTLATPFDVDRAIHRLDEVSARWVRLAPGESITLEWPAELVSSASRH